MSCRTRSRVRPRSSDSARSPLIHLLDAPSKFDETPYMGWMYLGLIASCIALAAGLWRSSDLRIWAAAAALPVRRPDRLQLPHAPRLTTCRSRTEARTMGPVSRPREGAVALGALLAEVYAIDTATVTCSRRIPVGAGPHGLSVWPQPGRHSLGTHGILR